MASVKLLDVAHLRNVLIYDPESGVLTWRHRSDVPLGWNDKYAGKPAFTANRNGYRVGKVNGVPYMAHRVAWAIHYGENPVSEIDHINGNPADNRIVNLRAADRFINNRNRARLKSNRSGFTGVIWGRSARKWIAQIEVDGQRKHLGTFAAKEDAIAARQAANEQYGFHKNHGRKK